MCARHRANLYANIEQPKRAQTVLNHPKWPLHKLITLSDIR
jgi:hypothetical protein